MLIIIYFYSYVGNVAKDLYIQADLWSPYLGRELNPRPTALEAYELAMMVIEQYLFLPLHNRLVKAHRITRALGRQTRCSLEMLSKIPPQTL